MVNYARMYAILCAAASRALDLLPETETNAPARELLERSLWEAEELYVTGEEDPRMGELPGDKA